LAQFKQLAEKILRSKELDAQLARGEVNAGRQIRQSVVAGFRRNLNHDLPTWSKLSHVVKFFNDPPPAGLFVIKSVTREPDPQPIEKRCPVDDECPPDLAPDKPVHELNGASAPDPKYFFEDGAIHNRQIELFKFRNNFWKS